MRLQLLLLVTTALVLLAAIAPLVARGRRTQRPLRLSPLVQGPLRGGPCYQTRARSSRRACVR